MMPASKETSMTRFRIVLGGLLVCTLAVVLAVAFSFERPVEAQEPPTGYENLVLCSMPGAAKAEALYATGINTLFNETFTVRVRNWKYLAQSKLWHGEWWLRGANGQFSWVPTATGLSCSFYPYDMDLDWIVQQ
jgi:hypothetical protein